MLMPQAGNTQRRTLALLSSLCLFLSAIEYIIPKPLPFMRIGLANLPLLLALDIFGPMDFFLLVMVKILGQGILSGSLFSYVFLFSLAGSLSSAGLMYALRKLLGQKLAGFAGIGCAGAMSSNAVQLILARFLIFGASLRYLVPPFLLSGLITGITLGIFCEIFCRRSLWYAIHSSGQFSDANIQKHKNEQEEALTEISVRKPEKNSFFENQRQKRQERWNKRLNNKLLFIIGLIIAAALILSPSVPICAIIFLLSCILAWISGKKNNIALSLIVMTGIIFFNLLTPYGKVLIEFGSLRITQGSLMTGLRKAFTLQGLVMLSGACIKSDLRLPGKFGLLLAEAFQLLEKMRERKNTIRRGHIIEGIDRLMRELEATV